MMVKDIWDTSISERRQIVRKYEKSKQLSEEIAKVEEKYGMWIGELADRFEEILGIDNIYGDSKLDIARDWKARHPDEKVMFIGDTTHDVKTAEILGADCFIVCAGHQCRERFDGIAARIFDSLDELVSYLRNL